MLRESEKYKEQDEITKKKIEAKNGLEQIIYSVKQTAQDEKFKGKISEDEKKACIDICTKQDAWLRDNQNATVDEFEAKKKEVEAVFNPIITRLYQ